MRICVLVLFACSLLDVAPALAHGPQLQINNVGGKIVTREVLTDIYTPLTDPKSVYVMPVLVYGGAWYARPETKVHPVSHFLEGQPVYYSGPGLAYGVGQTFAAGGIFTLQFDDGLRLWNGSGFVDASATALQAYRGGSIGASGELINPAASAVSSDSAPFAGLNFPPVPASNDDQSHSTSRLRFLGDGTTTPLGVGTTATEPVDGVYLARFVIASTQAALTSSDPFYFVMHKNAAWNEVQAAVRSLDVPAAQVQYLAVPEPASIVLAGIAVAAIGVTLRRRRKE